MTRKAYHVVPDNIRGGWDVRKDQETGTHYHFNTLEEALEYGRRASLDQGLDLVVYDPDDETAWTVSRSERASVEMVIDEHKSLPRDIREMLKHDPHTHYIRRGPIQPKDRPAPRNR